MGWIRQNKAIPIMKGFILSGEPIDGSIFIIGGGRGCRIKRQSELIQTDLLIAERIVLSYNTSVLAQNEIVESKRKISISPPTLVWRPAVPDTSVRLSA